MDEDILMAIALSEATWEDAGKDAPAPNLERVEEELGFEQQSDGVWLKDYPESCSNLNTTPAQSVAEG